MRDVNATTSSLEAGLATLAGFNSFAKTSNGAFQCQKTQKVYEEEQIRSINLIPCTDGCVYYVHTTEGAVGIYFEVLPEIYSDAA